MAHKPPKELSADWILVGVWFTCCQPAVGLVSGGRKSSLLSPPRKHSWEFPGKLGTAPICQEAHLWAGGPEIRVRTRNNLLWRVALTPCSHVLPGNSKLFCERWQDEIIMPQKYVVDFPQWFSLKWHLHNLDEHLWGHLHAMKTAAYLSAPVLMESDVNYTVISWFNGS